MVTTAALVALLAGVVGVRVRWRIARLPVAVRPRPGAGAASRVQPARWLGRRLRGLAGRPADDEADRRAGRVAVATVVAGVVAAPMAPIPALAAWWSCRRRRRRDDAARRRAVVVELPDVVDLCALAAGSGLTVPLTVEVVADHASGEIGAALVEARRRMRLGEPTSDAIESATGTLGEPARPLVAALVASDRYGAPLGPALSLVARDARLARRRMAEEAARQVPVKLLFPLVLCTLPAFALLTVVPLLAGSLRSLRL